MSVQSSQSTDVLELEFINANNQTTTISSGAISVSNANPPITNVTSFILEKDYFIPPNSFSFVLVDNPQAQGATSLSMITAFMQIGNQVNVKINGMSQCIGFIFDYHLSVNRHGGTELTVKCKDLLEYMAQGTCPPNLGSGKTTNYHFPANSSLQDMLVGICASFSAVSGIPIQVMTENSGSVDAAGGYKSGLRVKGKTPSSRSKSIATALNHITTPNPGESYLHYMMRLAKHAGSELKMADYALTLLYCKPPTYDRTNPSPFNIFHYLTAPNNQLNNVTSAEYYFNGDRQPSIVITESSTNGDGKFYQAAVKGVAINELTAYPVTGSPITFGDASLSAPIPIQSVLNSQQQLCAGSEGTGWFLAPFNTQLYNVKQTFPVQVQTKLSMPYYSMDYNAHTTGSDGETSYAASKILSECQDKYIEFVYHIPGWTMPGTGYVWQPDMMVQIVEETFSPSNPKTFNMWIKRVRYSKTRHGGTETEIVCSLPYTHNFELTS